MPRYSKISGKELGLGGVERHGGDVSVVKEHGAFIVKGFTPSGEHVIEGSRNLAKARKIAFSSLVVSEKKILLNTSVAAVP